jgi:hypothetical protein
MYYNENTVMYLPVSIYQHASTSLDPSYMKFSVSPSGNFDAERYYNPSDGKYYLKLSNFEGNEIDKSFEVTATYDDGVTGYTAISVSKPLTLSFRRVVDSLHMPNENNNPSNPMVVFKKVTKEIEMPIKHKLKPVGIANPTMAYLPYVSWNKNNNNISFAPQYSDYANYTGESLVSSSMIGPAYESILPVTGENVGTTTVTSTANGIDINGQRLSREITISVIDVVNPDGEQRLDDYDINMNPPGKPQPTYSKVLEVLGSDYDFNRLTITPSYDSQYFDLVIVPDSSVKTFTFKITPKLHTLLDGTDLELTIKYTNIDEYNTVTEIIRTSKVYIYEYDQVQ